MVTCPTLIEMFGGLEFENKSQELIATRCLSTYAQLVLVRNKRCVQAADALSWH